MASTDRPHNSPKHPAVDCPSTIPKRVRKVSVSGTLHIALASTILPHVYDGAPAQQHEEGRTEPDGGN
ncbi:hypothetical protein BDN70DRAFT_884859 [Pholiota conissans]|uniref:Uncharacterized protein n=1 Tax=Pholiota conissans TaxID=109636 RepID=A0A9P5YTE7_9AGAR|nr:hypothetical protein BDN70DRAFT_884859 [Pholiota conissans]